MNTTKPTIVQQSMSHPQLQQIEQQGSQLNHNNNQDRTTTTTTTTTINTSMILQNLRQVCNAMQQNKDDVTGSKSIHHQISNNNNNNKRLKLDIQFASNGRIDLFGSFICPNTGMDGDNDSHEIHDSSIEQRYDFFDTNDIQALSSSSQLPLPPPIFPYEFPDQIPTHSAAWWGIIEPSAGVGKYQIPPLPLPEEDTYKSDMNTKQPQSSLQQSVVDDKNTTTTKSTPMSPALRKTTTTTTSSSSSYAIVPNDAATTNQKKYDANTTNKSGSQRGRSSNHHPHQYSNRK